MATLSSTALTLADWAKRLDDGYKVASIIELLSQTNEILDDMLVEEAVQGPLLSCFQSLEIVARRQCAFREIGHDNPPEICRETTGGWPMGPGRPGHRIA